MKHILVKCDTVYDGNILRVVFADYGIENKRFADKDGYVYIYAKVDIVRWIILKRRFEKEYLAGANFEVLDRV